MNRNNEGITLIMIVVMVIIILILSSIIIITIKNTDLINNTNDVAEKVSVGTVQEAASVIWLEACYENLDVKNKELKLENIKNKVINELVEGNIDVNNYAIDITLDDVLVTAKGNWELQKEIENGKIMSAIVTDGVNKINVGSVVNYMSEGIGNNSYKDGWKILGVDDFGRLLLVSSEGVTENKVHLSEKSGYQNGLEVLQAAVNSYKDGKIGVSVRSINEIDIDRLSLYDKTTYNPGQINAYGNDVTYSRELNSNAVKYSYLYDGETKTGKLGYGHAIFNYYNKDLDKWEDVKDGDVTMKIDFYQYSPAQYLSNDTEAYKMLYRNKDNTGSADTYWLANQSIYTSARYVAFCIRIISQEVVSVERLISSHNVKYSADYDVRAVVTLSPKAKLVENKTVGGYDVVL